MIVTTNARRKRPPRGDGINKARVLAAARAEFSSKGYQTATMRSIAALAGVDVALVAHYFDNKDGLFAATIELPDQAREILSGALTGDPATQGERLTRAYFSLWEDPTSGPQMKVLARSVLSNDAAAASLRELLFGATTKPDVAPLLDQRHAGFVLAMSHLAGIAFNRYLNHTPYLRELHFEKLVALVAPPTQHYLDAVDHTNGQ